MVAGAITPNGEPDQNEWEIMGVKNIFANTICDPPIPYIHQWWR